MGETVEIVHLVSESGVPVTVAAADVDHYLSVGFVSAAQPEPEPEPEPEVEESAPETDEVAVPTSEPEQTPKRGGKK